MYTLCYGDILYCYYMLIKLEDLIHYYSYRIMGYFQKRNFVSTANMNLKNMANCS